MEKWDLSNFSDLFLLNEKGNCSEAGSREPAYIIISLELNSHLM